MAFFREQIKKGIIDVVRKKRSSDWRKVRKAFIKANNVCACCGREKGLEVHHIEDFSTSPHLELEWGNLITLCGKYCHFIFGHLMNWQSINPDIRKDAENFFEKKQNRRE